MFNSGIKPFGFGASATSAAPATGMFGAPAVSAAPATSLFGAPAASAATSTSMFGAPPASPAPGLTMGMFGSTLTSTPASAAMGLFGAKSAAPATSMFGAPAPTATPMFGGIANNPSVAPGAPPVPAGNADRYGKAVQLETTRLEDLPDAFIQMMKNLDGIISSTRIKSSAKNDADDVLKRCGQVQEKVTDLRQSLQPLSDTQEEGKMAAQDVTARVQRSHRQTDVGFRALEAFWRTALKKDTQGKKEGEAPAHGWMVADASSVYAGTSVAYLKDVVADQEMKLQACSVGMNELTRVTSNLSRRPVPNPAAIGDVMSYQRRSFYSLVTKVSGIHDNLHGQRQKYREIRKRTHGDHRDPFAERKAHRNDDRSSPLASFNEIALRTLRRPAGPIVNPSPAPAPGVTGVFGNTLNVGATPAPTTAFGAPAGGMFGQAATAKPSMFGQAATPAMGGGMFGHTAAKPSLFGQTTAGGMFGAPAASAAAPMSGFFGAPATSAAPATGMFGAPVTSAAPTTGLFGAPASSAAPATGMFGAPAASAAPATGSLFGAPAAQAGSLFGGFK